MTALKDWAYAPGDIMPPPPGADGRYIMGESSARTVVVLEGQLKQTQVANNSC
jgi:hypothetical protein